MLLHLDFLVSVYEIMQHENQFCLILSIMARFKQKCVLGVKYLSFFSATFVQNISRSDKYTTRQTRDMNKNACRSLCKVSVIENSCLLRCDAASLSKRFPTFRKDVARLASRVQDP